MELEDFKYGGTNITSLRIVDPDKPEVRKVVEQWMYGELKFGRSIDPEVNRITVRCVGFFILVKNVDQIM